MNQIESVYKILIKAYGPQGWWPLTRRGKSRHYVGLPKNDKDIFEIMCGAVLTQNTAWTNVEKALKNLYDAGMLDFSKLARAKKEKVGELIRPAGYYNQKAERLILLACVVQNEGLKKISGRKDLREYLLSLKGVGPETADSIMLYAFGKLSFVIDAYTKRIFSRLGLCAVDVDYHELQKKFHEFLDTVGIKAGSKVEIFQEYHALIVEHAKRHCKTKPLCKGCVLEKNCKFAKKPYY